LEKAEIPGKDPLAFVRRATVSPYTMAADCVVLLRHAAVSGYVMAADCASMRKSATSPRRDSLHERFSMFQVTAGVHRWTTLD